MTPVWSVGGIGASLVRGLLIGLAMSAPIGPVALLSLRRTLKWRMATGVVTGLGASLADGIYVTLSLLGVNVLAPFVRSHAALLHCFGGLVLLGFAVAIGVRARPPVVFDEDPAEPPHVLSAGLSGFALAGLNPANVTGIAAVVTWMAWPCDLTAVIFTLAGVFAGALTWWLCLNGLAASMRQQLGPSLLKRIDQVTALVLGLFALASFGFALVAR